MFPAKEVWSNLEDQEKKKEAIILVWLWNYSYFLSDSETTVIYFYNS